MKIDIFRNNDIFKYLTQFNNVVLEAASSIKYTPDNNYDLSKNEASYWFNPENIRYTPMTPRNAYYPEPHPIQFDEKFCLEMHSANYTTLFLVATLYADRKNILFEDIGAGLGQLSFYLSKLGFNNFSFVDNFTQLPRIGLDTMISHIKGICTVNQLTEYSTVCNLIQYPVYPKRINSNNIVYLFNKIEKTKEKAWVSPALELACSNYPCDWLPSTFSELCVDEDEMALVYCRKDKLNEFRDKLKEYQI